MGDVPLFQAQDVVKAQLPLAPLHHKAVGIEQQHGGEKGHHDASKPHQTLEIPGTPDGGHDVADGQVTQDIVHGRGAHAGEEIGPVVAPVPGQVHQRQPGKESALTHGLHRLGSARSGCRKCAGTAPPASPRPGRAGDTPFRPAGTAPARRGWPPSPSGSP